MAYSNQSINGKQYSLIQHSSISKCAVDILWFPKTKTKTKEKVSEHRHGNESTLHVTQPSRGKAGSAVRSNNSTRALVHPTLQPLAHPFPLAPAGEHDPVLPASLSLWSLFPIVLLPAYTTIFRRSGPIQRDRSRLLSHSWVMELSDPWQPYVIPSVPPHSPPLPPPLSSLTLISFMPLSSPLHLEKRKKKSIV